MSLELLALVAAIYLALARFVPGGEGWIAPAAHPFLALGVGFLLTGVEHFVNADSYVRLMQDWIPSKKTVVLISAAVRVIAGVMMLFPATRAIGAHAALVLMLIVAPVNLRVALAGDSIQGLNMPVWRRWFRLALHVGWIVWAAWCCRLSW